MFTAKGLRLVFFNSYILPTCMFVYADIIWGDRGNVASLEKLQVYKTKQCI